MSVSIKRGDQVVVITGKDKGKKGKVLQVNVEDATCVVDGVNVVVKHKKARGQNQKSAREKKAGNIHVSNVMVLCKCGKPTRVSHKEVAGKNVRCCVKCKEVLDKKFTKVKDKEVKGKEVSEGTKTEEVKEKKTLQRREVKTTADSTVKKKGE